MLGEWSGLAQALQCERVRLRPSQELPSPQFFRRRGMDLGTWLPALFGLGLVWLGLLFAFLVACERV